MSALCARIDATTGDTGRINALVVYLHSPGLTNALERVIYSGSGGMLADTPEGMAAEMRATADTAHDKDSRVSIDPFEHLIISFTEGDAVTKKDFERAAKVALKHLGMESHQYAWAVHNDTGNEHMHLVISRINPETLRAITIPFPVKQAEKIGALVNDALGMEPMDNNRYIVNDDGGVERIPQTAVKQPDLLSLIISTSKSWDEFHTRTREAGINYERKGSGAVINGEKASDIDRSASLSKLIKRWGEFTPAAGQEAIKYVAPIHVERARDRAAERKSLSDKHYKERGELFNNFKERKSDVWKDKTIHGFLRAGLASVIAAEQAKATAELRDKQKAEREALRLNLNRDQPLLDKPLDTPNSIHGISLQVEVEHKDIRAFKPFIDNNNRRVIYRKSENSAASFIDTGKQVSIINRSNESVLAALQLSTVKFGKWLTITGSDDFKQQAIRISVDNGITIANPELQEQISVERERVTNERRSIIQTNYPNRDEFKRLADAVPADRWRITLGSYVEVEGRDGKLWTPTSILRDDLAPPLTTTGAGKGHDGLSVEQISQRWGYLEQCQRDETKARVILTPASDALHIIHIDDVSQDALARLKADGYIPAAIIATSPDKRNVLLTCPKDPSLADKQQHEVSKKLSQQLNKQYGDPDARNAMQPFRAPGFMNMKPKSTDGKYPEIVLEHAQRVNCEKLSAMAAELQKTPEITSVRLGREADISQAGDETKAYFCHVAAIRKDAEASKLPVRKRFIDGSLDQSSIDVMAAQRMRMTGWTKYQIEQGVANGCNAVRAANGDREKRGVPEYASWVAEAAEKGDLSKFEHQFKYRINDEKAAGIVSPVAQRQEQETNRQAGRN